MNRHNVIGMAWGWGWRLLLVLALIALGIFALYSFTGALESPAGLYPGDN